MATNCEIEKSFGKEISNLVQGVTKLSKLQLPDKEVREASNFSNHCCYLRRYKSFTN